MGAISGQASSHFPLNIRVFACNFSDFRFYPSSFCLLPTTPHRFTYSSPHVSFWYTTRDKTMKRGTYSIRSMTMNFAIFFSSYWGYMSCLIYNFQCSILIIKIIRQITGSHLLGRLLCFRHRFQHIGLIGKLPNLNNNGSAKQQADDLVFLTYLSHNLACKLFRHAKKINGHFWFPVTRREEKEVTAVKTATQLGQCLSSLMLFAMRRILLLFPTKKDILYNPNGLSRLGHQTKLVSGSYPIFRHSKIRISKPLYAVRSMDKVKSSTLNASVACIAAWKEACLAWVSPEREDTNLHSPFFTLYLPPQSIIQVIVKLAIKHCPCFLMNLGILENNCSLMCSHDFVFGSCYSVSFLECLERQCVTNKLNTIIKLDFKRFLCFTILLESLKSSGISPHSDVLLLDFKYYYCHISSYACSLKDLIHAITIATLLAVTDHYLSFTFTSRKINPFKLIIHSWIPYKHNSDNHTSESSKHKAFEKMQKHVSKDGANKWVSVLHKFTGKSQATTDCTDSIGSHSEPSRVNDDSSDVWDIEPMRHGPQGVPKDMFAMLHLFCATYSHLLLVLDDIEFYEKQVPFKIEQQRRIASMLNTLVYNGLSHVSGHHNRPLMDCAVRCLHLLYERDCRHPFCPPALWLSPARKSRPPIAVAARTHEVLAANLRSDDSSASLSVGSVVTIVPHVFPFEERVEMFREFIKMDKASRKMAGEISEPGSRAIEIVVRRGHIVEDGFRQLNSLGSRLKSSIHVSFVSECGLLEAGLDYGGLSKEFLTDISKSAFSPEYGLFSQTSTSDRLLIPTASARYLENGLQMIEFLGRVVGKALYEGILLDYSFSHVFVQKLLGRYSFLDELSTLDPELYRNLMYVKNYDGDVKELSIDFTVTEESLGKMYVVELKSGGKDISVTNENKMQYIHAMADYKLNQQILPFSNAFYRGVTDLITPSWLKLFNASEFNQLLSGGNYDIDVDDLKNNTRYTGGYNEGRRTIKIFWEVIKGFEPKERCMLLKFVTSCSRAPLLGFKYLQPPFTIHKVACDVPLWATIGGQDVDRLPSASTCYNTLKLPTYKRPGTLRAKLLYAISSNAGFELS
ncbi:hypothetical protein JHK87_007751 [Glycine soja]|nr:hypothetical protein JHK87_007751 [Glycine soja]